MDLERPLRVAFLLPTFPELSNTFILAQITGLLDRGHDVDLFAIGRNRFEGAHPDVSRYGLASRMRHLVIPRPLGRRVSSALRLLFTAGGQSPVLLDALDPTRHGRGALSLSRLHTAASFLRSRPYDVLHCQFGNHGPSAERLVALGATQAKLVTSFRGADLTTHLARHPRRYRDLLARGALFLPVSRDFRDRLVAVGAPVDRVLMHHSGIDLKRFSFEPRRPPTERPRLLFVGRLTEKKGLTYALEALAVLRRAGAEADLTVVGEGPLEPVLKSTTSTLGLDDRVRFVGGRSHDEVIAMMHASHILVAPSVTAANGDQEGIPNVLKEAMATGLPVVSTRHSGIPELVQHGVSGLLAPERDVGALAAQLGLVLAHPERWSDMGRAGRQAVEAGFDADRLNDLLVERYRSILQDGLPSGRTPRGTLATARRS